MKTLSSLLLIGTLYALGAALMLVLPAPAGAAEGYKLLVDVSHGSMFTAEEAEAEFSTFIAVYEGRGHQVTVGSRFEDILDFYTVVLLLPTQAYTPEEIDLAREFLDGNRKLVVLGEYSLWYSGNAIINGLLDGLGAGVTIEDASVNDPVHNLGGLTYQITIWDFTENCLNDGLNMVVHTAAAPLSVTSEGSVLYWSSPESYLFEDPEQMGPFPMAAVADPELHPDWRLIVWGDTSQFTDYGTALVDNSGLMDFNFECASAEDSDDDTVLSDKTDDNLDPQGKLEGGCCAF